MGQFWDVKWLKGHPVVENGVDCGWGYFLLFERTKEEEIIRTRRLVVCFFSILGPSLRIFNLMTFRTTIHQTICGLLPVCTCLFSLLARNIGWKWTSGLLGSPGRICFVKGLWVVIRQLLFLRLESFFFCFLFGIEWFFWAWANTRLVNNPLDSQEKESGVGWKIVRILYVILCLIACVSFLCSHARSIGNGHPVCQGAHVRFVLLEVCGCWFGNLCWWDCKFYLGFFSISGWHVLGFNKHETRQQPFGLSGQNKSGSGWKPAHVRKQIHFNSPNAQLDWK